MCQAVCLEKQVLGQAPGSSSFSGGGANRAVISSTLHEELREKKQVEQNIKNVHGSEKKTTNVYGSDIRTQNI